MALMHITIKAQTQKHTVHWTHLWRAFPYHGCGALFVLLRDWNPGGGNQSVDSGMTETPSARMQHDVGADFKVPLLMFSGRNDDFRKARNQRGVGGLDP